MVREMKQNIEKKQKQTNKGKFFFFFLGQFLAYGTDVHSGAIYSSPDGISWSLYSNISSFFPDSVISQVASISQGSGMSLFATVDIYPANSVSTKQI